MCVFAFSKAAPLAYGGSQARGRIGAVAAGLRQSHSNAGSEPRKCTIFKALTHRGFIRTVPFIDFVLKYILSDMNIATFFPLFTLNLSL